MLNKQAAPVNHWANYNAKRMNFLLVAVFTLINVVIAATGSGSYFLFSAYIPYYLVVMSAYLTGNLKDMDYSDWEGEFLPNTVMYVCVGIAVVILALYVLFFFISKKNNVPLIIGTVFFCIDTVGMFLLCGIALDYIMDYLFHAYVLYCLISCLVSYKKAKQEQQTQTDVSNDPQGLYVQVNTEQAGTDGQTSAAPKATEADAVFAPSSTGTPEKTEAGYGTVSEAKVAEAGSPEEPEEPEAPEEPEIPDDTDNS